MLSIFSIKVEFGVCVDDGNHDNDADDDVTVA